MKAVLGTLVLVLVGCAPLAPRGAVVRWLTPAEAVPHGSAPGARHRLLATHADGSKEYALVLAAGDEVWTALGDFARAEQVTAARFTGIGAVRDLEVGWFDPARKRYQAMRLPEQGEILSLVGDVALNANGAPVVHAHVVFGRSDASAVGGHLLGAITSPTLEVFMTTFPQRIGKKPDPGTDLQIFDLEEPHP